MCQALCCHWRYNDINKAIYIRVSLGKSPVLTKPQFPYLENWVITGIILVFSFLLFTSNQLTNSVNSTTELFIFTISFANTLVQASWLSNTFIHSLGVGRGQGWKTVVLEVTPDRFQTNTIYSPPPPLPLFLSFPLLAPPTLAFWLLLEHGKVSHHLGPLCHLFPLPERLFP